MKDRYNFNSEFDIEKFNTHAFDDTILSTKEDEKISARRKERKEKAERAKDVVVIKPEDLSHPITKKRLKINLGRLSLSLLALVVVVAFVVVAGLKLTRLQVEKKAAQKKLDELTLKTEQLEAELQELDSDEYIENSARSNLHMIKEGEVMYIINPDLDTEDENPEINKPK